MSLVQRSEKQCTNVQGAMQLLFTEAQEECILRRARVIDQDRRPKAWSRVDTRLRFGSVVRSGSNR
jgi:hypothetical protein